MPFRQWPRDFSRFSLNQKRNIEHNFEKVIKLKIGDFIIYENVISLFYYFQDIATWHWVASMKPNIR